MPATNMRPGPVSRPLAASTLVAVAAASRQRRNSIRARAAATRSSAWHCQRQKPLTPRQP